MTLRQVTEEYGVPMAVAESWARALARDGKLYRFEGVRRVYLDRDDIEAKLGYSSSSSGGRT